MERPATALIIDPSDQIRVLLATFLGRAGFAVESAAEIDRAVSKLRRSQFDVVVVVDPAYSTDGDGIERLAAAFPESRTVVIASPPHAPISERVHAVLEKPFDLETLLTTVLECTQTRHLHQL